MARKYLQGKFSPKNPKKYKGDVTNIVYRSGLELTFMRFLDEHVDILEWGSEEIVIPYRSPIDGKARRYFPDFILKKRTLDGEIITELVEIKPASQTQMPRKTTKKSPRRLTEETMTFAINKAKWNAAEAYCRKHKYKFRIITEKELK
jgi:hypothetical protein